MAQDGGSMAVVVGREQDVQSGGVSRYSRHVSSASQSNVGNVHSMSITAEPRTDRLVSLAHRQRYTLELQSLLLTHDYTIYTTSYPTLGKRCLLSWFQRVLLQRTRYLRDGQ